MDLTLFINYIFTLNYKYNFLGGEILNYFHILLLFTGILFAQVSVEIKNVTDSSLEIHMTNPAGCSYCTDPSYDNKNGCESYGSTDGGLTLDANWIFDSTIDAATCAGTCSDGSSPEETCASNGTCSDSTYTLIGESSCEADGLCSLSVHQTEAACTAANGTWTAKTPGVWTSNTWTNSAMNGQYFSGEIGGFQFELLGTILTWNSASGGSAGALNTASTGNTLLGFSTTGATIPASSTSTLLTSITFTDDPADTSKGICFGEDTGSSGNNAFSDKYGDYINTVWGACSCDNGVADACGECEGNNPINCYATNSDDVCTLNNQCEADYCDCSGTCGGNAYVDNCDICDENPQNDCTLDCAEEWGGTSLIDCEGSCVELTNASPDEDSDGYCDDVDLCPGSPLNAVVNSEGCTQDQLSELCSYNCQYTYEDFCEYNIPAPADFIFCCPSYNLSNCYDDSDSTGYTQDYYGCPNPGACNYEPMATIDDGSCLYFDCSGDCGGSAILDECGVCEGDGTSCLNIGDINSDDLINVQDLILLVEAILTVDFNILGDINNDGLLNVQDVILLLNVILGEDNTIDSDNDGVYDEEDIDPNNPNICSDIDLDSCDDCAFGSFDPLNDGYDPDGDGICEESNCLLYTSLAENELESIFFSIYNDDSVESCLDNLDEDTNCLEEILDLDSAVELYNIAYAMCPTDPATNFGSAIINLLSITTDPELNSLLERWFTYLDDEDEMSLARISNFNIGIPNRDTSYDDFNTSKIYDTFTSFLVNPTNVLGRSTEDVPYLEELQIILEEEFITRLVIAIERLENVVDKEYNFIISGEMQGDIYQEDIEMDDTEFYLIKAYMHFYNSLFHIISTYDIGGITLDINDYDILNYNTSFLNIRDGKQNNLPYAYQELENLYESLDKSLNYLLNETDWQENDYIQNDFSDNNYLEIQDNLSAFEDCLDGECIQSIEGCDNWECSFEYDEYWEDYNCDCVGESVEMEHAISLSSFMNNPPQNLKDFVPSYTITTDECNEEIEVENSAEMFFEVGAGMGLNSFSIIFDSDTFIHPVYSVEARTFKSITLNTNNGNITIDRPEDWTSLSLSDQDIPIENNSEIRENETRTHFNWHVVNDYYGSYYITANDGFQPTLYISLYDSDNNWDLVSEYYFDDHYASNYFGYTCCSGVNSSIENTIIDSNPFPCPKLSWTADSYNEWIAEWNGDIMTIDINSNNGINSLSFIFNGDPFYWNEYGYYARKFNSITINSALGETIITKPEDWPEDGSLSYTYVNSVLQNEDFVSRNDNIPNWIDTNHLANPMSWHLISLGSGDVFYFVAANNGNEIYAQLYSDQYWGMSSNNNFSDHWIDFSSQSGQFILSFNSSAHAESKQPIDITINGLYPYINLEDILLLYENLFNIDENNWKKTIGGD